MRTPGSAAELQRVRMIAANLIGQGRSAGEIAAALGVHVQTVRHWRRRLYAHGTAEALKAKPHPGRPPLLTPQQKQELVGHLLRGPSACGFDRRHFWTTRMIAQLIGEKFAVRYHHDYVGEMLHALGFTCQKPMRRARERDEVKIEQWRQTVWPEILKKVPGRTACSSPPTRSASP